MNALITITGPTCSGKTVLQKLLEAKGLQGIVSFTTRPPRAGEVNGEHYWFMSPDRINVLDGDGRIAEKITLGQHTYGILGQELETKLGTGNTVVVVEPNGVAQLTKYCADNNLRLIRVYVCNPAIVNIARLLKRHADNPDQTFDTSQRVISLMTVEQSWLYQSDYELIFNRFDSGCQDAVVNSILEMLAA